MPNDWRKSFDDGTARASRSLFLLVGLGFALLCDEVMKSERIVVCAVEEAPGVVCASWWFITLLTSASIPILCVLFAIQLATAGPPYLDFAQSVATAIRLPQHADWARTLMTFLLAIAATPILVGLVLVADGTVGGAMLHLVASTKEEG